jgi:hypothetical protein
MFLPAVKTIVVGEEDRPYVPLVMAWNPDDIDVGSVDPEDPPYWSFTANNLIVIGSINCRANEVITQAKWYFEVEFHVSNNETINFFPDFPIAGIMSAADDWGSPSFMRSLYCEANGDGIQLMAGVEYGAVTPLSLDGENDCIIIEGDNPPYEIPNDSHLVFCFAGDQSGSSVNEGRLWVGLNGQWLGQWKEEEWVWDEGLQEDVLVPEHWSMGDPENDLNPTFADIGTLVSPFFSYHTRNSRQELTIRGRFDPDDLLYSPPTGFSGIIGQESTSNFVRFDPHAKTTTCQLSNSDLTVTGANELAFDQIRTTTVIGNANWYVELRLDAHPTGIVFGVADMNFVIQEPFGVGGSHWVLNNGIRYPLGGVWFASMANVTVIRMAFRDGQLWFGDQYSWRGDPVAGTTPAFFGIPVPVYLVVGVANEAQATLVTNGFAFQPPVGFSGPQLGALVTLTVLRDLIIQPITRSPTQHDLMHYAGL